MAVTRGYLQRIGKEIAAELTPRAVVVVEMESESEAWAVCAVEGDVEHITEHDAHEYPGFSAGDEVVLVRKYEPLEPGSSTYEITNKCFYVDICDLRTVLGDGEFAPAKGRSRADPLAAGRRVLDAEAKHRVLRLIPNI